jgi:hypothetical protein
LKNQARDVHRNSFGLAKQKPFEMKSGKTQEKEIYDCGWSAVYSARFGLEDFSCLYSERNNSGQ